MISYEAANRNDTHWLEIGVVPLRNDPRQWLVEAIDHQSEGEIYRTIFQGPDAEKRARAYAVTLEPQPPAPRTAREPTPPASSGGVGREEVKEAIRQASARWMNTRDTASADEVLNEAADGVLALLSGRQQ